MAAAVEVAVAAARAAMASYEHVEFPGAAGAAPPRASSNQEVSQAAPELVPDGGDDGDQNLAAAGAQLMSGRPEHAPASRTSARRSPRPKRELGSGELGLQGDGRSVSCLR